MLRKAVLKNYQSHKETVLEFVPGVNVIIGASDAGKSAIFRGITWPITNRPLGDAFRSEWGGDTESVLHFSEGTIIERLRSAARNEYIVNGKELKAFGSEVPEEVLNALQLDAYNIQSQMDPAFLLSHTPGEAARMLNKAASIDDIDHTISGIKKSLDRLNKDIGYEEKQLKETAQEMVHYANLPEIEKAIEQVENLETQKAEITRRALALKRIVGRAKQVQQALAKTSHIPALLERHSTTEKLHNTYKNRLVQHQRLCRAVERAKEIQEYLERTAGAERALQLLNETNKRLRSLEEWSKQGALSKMLAAKARRAAQSISASDKEIERLEKEYKKLSPATCPLCGGAMNE